MTRKANKPTEQIELVTKILDLDQPIFDLLLKAGNLPPAEGLKRQAYIDINPDYDNVAAEWYEERIARLIARLKLTAAVLGLSPERVSELEKTAIQASGLPVSPDWLPADPNYLDLPY